MKSTDTFGLGLAAYLHVPCLTVDLVRLLYFIYNLNVIGGCPICQEGTELSMLRN